MASRPELSVLKGLHPTPGFGRGRRSALFWWLFDNADGVRGDLELAKPTWNQVAAVIPDTAVDAAGKKPTGDRVRKTWASVCKAKGWLDAPKPVPKLQAHPSAPRTVGAPDADDLEEKFKRYGFRAAGPWTPKNQ